ncbi:MAG: hypothetical protein K2X93_20300 [Candidatus Obscuribacterales bacterium]|nr:hypothetical protein [Candidatus Obscuribacterales bacterium]
MSLLDLPRRKNWLAGFLCGTGSSLVAFSTSSFLAPNQFVGMAMIIGFTYIALLCIWIGWRQGTRERTIRGVGIGLACGLAYLGLATYEHVFRNWFGFFTDEFIGLFVTYPAILSGIIMVLMGSTTPWTFGGAFARFWKGAWAGLLLGASHFALVFVFLFLGSAIHRMFGDYGASSFPFYAPALALGCASALYFPMVGKTLGLQSEARQPAWLAKLTVWRVGIVLFVLMTVAGIAFSNMIPINEAKHCVEPAR